MIRINLFKIIYTKFIFYIIKLILKKQILSEMWYIL